MKGRIFYILDIVLDRIVARIRIIFYPFYIILKLIDGIRVILLFLNNEFLKIKFGHCGDGVRLHGNIKITSPCNVFIGDNVHINQGAFLRAEGRLRIEDNVHIARNLTLYTVNHDYHGERLPYDSGLISKPVIIKKNVWIGMNVCITPGVTIGEGAIVGMGTVVSGDVPRLAVIGGAPFRIIKYRDEEHYNELNMAGHFSGMSGVMRYDGKTD